MRHHTDNVGDNFVNADRLADQRCILAVPSLPQTVRKNGYRRCAGEFIGFHKFAPHNWLYPKDGKRIGSGPQTDKRLRRVVRIGNISPYLNLFRGQNTGINYYLGTRSEQQRRQNAQEFRDDIDELERRAGAGEVIDEFGQRQIPVQSGTPTSFGTTLGYYTNRQNYIAPSVARMGAGVGVYGPPPGRGGRR